MEANTPNLGQAQPQLGVAAPAVVRRFRPLVFAPGFGSELLQVERPLVGLQQQVEAPDGVGGASDCTGPG